MIEEHTTDDLVDMAEQEKMHLEDTKVRFCLQIPLYGY